ncbi:XkdX family protein [Brevibacillus fortis]|uniref:XkdX family protein n=1 Tax=Brevibacillus fortis TaxID=2126352 RepID=UPI0038FC59DD
MYRFGEYTAEDVARFVELGKLTPEQYEGTTGEKYGIRSRTAGEGAITVSRIYSGMKST